MSATDDFTGFSASLTAAAAVTPDDGSDLDRVTRALWAGGTGDLRVTMLDGQTVTFPALTPGWHPLRVTHVHATGTKAAC